MRPDLIRLRPRGQRQNFIDADHMSSGREAMTCDQGKTRWQLSLVQNIRPRVLCASLSLKLMSVYTKHQIRLEG